MSDDDAYGEIFFFFFSSDLWAVSLVRRLIVVSSSLRFSARVSSWFFFLCKFEEKLASFFFLKTFPPRQKSVSPLLALEEEIRELIKTFDQMNNFRNSLAQRSDKLLMLLILCLLLLRSPSLWHLKSWVDWNSNELCCLLLVNRCKMCFETSSSAQHDDSTSTQSHLTLYSISQNVNGSSTKRVNIRKKSRFLPCKAFFLFFMCSPYGSDRISPTGESELDWKLRPVPNQSIQEDFLLFHIRSLSLQRISQNSVGRNVHIR